MSTNTQDPANPAAVPDLDGWGWDSYWQISDWMTWHRAMVAAYGLEAANRTFIGAWNKQTMGANPLGARTFNVEFREYMRSVGLLSQVYEGAGPFAALLNPAGSVLEATDAVSESVGSAASGLKAVGPALLFVGVLALGYLYFRKLAPSHA